MLRTFACVDMFTELLNRRQYRSAAAIFIDAADAVEQFLCRSSITDNSNGSGGMIDELNDAFEELTTMWKVAMSRTEAEVRPGGLDTNQQQASFQNLLEFTVWNRASRSNSHREFYQRVTDAEIPVERSLGLDTVAWFLST